MLLEIYTTGCLAGSFQWPSICHYIPYLVLPYLYKEKYPIYYQTLLAGRETNFFIFDQKSLTWNRTFLITNFRLLVFFTLNLFKQRNNLISSVSITHHQTVSCFHICLHSLGLIWYTSTMSVSYLCIRLLFIFICNGTNNFFL